MGVVVGSESETLRCTGIYACMLYAYIPVPTHECGALSVKMQNEVAAIHPILVASTLLNTLSGSVCNSS